MTGAMAAFVAACFLGLAVLLAFAYRETRRQNVLLGHLCAGLKRRPTRAQLQQILVEQMIETTRAAAGEAAAARAISDPPERREA